MSVVFSALLNAEKWGHPHNRLNLRRSHDDMNATIRAHNIADLSYRERERRFLKWLLHLTTGKQSEIATLVVRRTIRMHLCQLAKRV